jgi:lysophospholipase L1-like esterase
VTVNPNTPGTLGIEWPASRAIDDQLSPTLGRATTVDVGTTQTVDRMKAFLVCGQGPTGRGYVEFDIYDAANLDHGSMFDVIVTNLSDAIDHSAQPYGLHRSDTNSAVNLTGCLGYANWPNPTSLSDPLWVKAVKTSFNSQGASSGTTILRVKAGGGTFDALTGASVTVSNPRLLAVGVDVLVYNPQTTSSGRPVRMAIAGLLNDGTTDVFGSYDNVTSWGATEKSIDPPTGNPLYRRLTFWFPYNPFTTGGRSWAAGDIISLFSGFGPGHFGVRLRSLVTTDLASPKVVRVGAAGIRYRYVTERRRATCFMNVPVNLASGGEWVEGTFENPATRAPLTWTKTAGEKLLVVGRTTNVPNQQLWWRGVDCAATVGAETERQGGGIGAVDVPMRGAPESSPQGVPTDQFTRSLPDAGPRARAFYFRQGTLTRPEAQPYVRPVPIDVVVFFPFQQKFTPPVTAEYGLVSFVVFNDQATHDAGTPLTVQIRRVSNSAVLASHEFSPLQLPDPDDRWHRVRIRFGSAPNLVAGTQYAIWFGNFHPASRWRLQYVTTVTTEAASRGFGGTTDVLSDSFGDHPEQDAVVSVSQVPAAPTGRAAFAQFYDTSRNLEGDCVVPRVPFVRLQWAATALGATFGHYEIRRAGETIARIYDEQTATFSDLEAPPDQPLSYDMRVVDNAGSFSDWVKFPAVTLPLADQWAIALVSNAKPGLTLGLNYEEPISWEPVVPDHDVIRHFYGRDKQVVFRDPQDRGDRFTRDLVLAFNDPQLADGGRNSGRAVFDELVALAHAAVPYVCVIDGRGRRYFTSPAVRSLTETQPVDKYLATVDFTEVTGPTAVDQTAPVNDEAGSTMVRASLSGWLVELTSPIRHLYAIGDSITEGVITGNSWPGLLYAMLRTTGEWGQCAGIGTRHTASDDVTFLGSGWQAADGDELWDRMPWVNSFGVNGSCYTSPGGSGNVVRWTKPSWVQGTITAVDVLWIDGAGAGDFSWSTNGGGTWQAMGQTRVGDNRLKKFTVTGANITQIWLRAATAGGAATRIYFAGFRPHYNLTLTGAAQAFEIHNLGSAANFAATLVRDTPGDQWDIFNLYNPTLVTLEFSNDVVLTSPETYGANVQEILDAIPQPCDVVGIVPPMQNGRPPDTQKAFGKIFREVMLDNRHSFIDFQVIWGSYAEAGALMADALHPSAAGERDMAHRVRAVLADALRLVNEGFLP